MEMKVKELIEERNKIEAEIASINLGIVNSNTRILLEEVLNLLDGVGAGYTEGDYYARKRYYSSIAGVKNFVVVMAAKSYPSGRPVEDPEPDALWVKVLDSRGLLLPKTLTVRGVEYEVRTVKSSRYEDGVKY